MAHGTGQITQERTDPPGTRGGAGPEVFIRPDAFTPVGRPALRRGERGWLERVELITPAMCGNNSLFVGQLGDWTWDAVGSACGIDPYTAVDDEGNPVYLSFAYFRVRSATGLCAEDLTFGDRLRVRSKVMSSGGDSLLTVHRATLASSSSPAEPDGSADDVESFFGYRAPQTIHVENFNRWIQRSGHGTNHGLRPATPAGFRTAHLPVVPDRHTPRRTWASARRNVGFRTEAEPPARATLNLDYQVNASRDLNGVGLLYFASYFSIVDWAVLSLWRSLQRPASAFLSRRVLDRQLCFIANANAEDVLGVQISTFSDTDGTDVVDVAVRRADGDLLAVARQRLQHPTPC
ncbi:LnmK family bifunctional acyltransferase/decarboxylase [Kineosporia babensis]|uniref:LnmK N-terminal domain-containing protein n=1 Tax=Kineosporia babensis TaxID=499548 RepID=A0A9X1NLG2_9ACTN|nr:LnmK family bifunctional acyltransferase/decarboxylase [Kineosporia babensis]MCD5315709.1 hypothetical protein [Kineosporia babensis]